jgi:hypothetical protein
MKRKVWSAADLVAYSSDTDKRDSSALTAAGGEGEDGGIVLPPPPGHAVRRDPKMLR